MDSAQLTACTGNLLSSKKWLGLKLHTAWNSACVTSYRPIQNPSTILTSVCGRPPSPPTDSPGSQPIVNAPGLIQTDRAARARGNCAVAARASSGDTIGFVSATLGWALSSYPTTSTTRKPPVQ